jgi:hypothetical protein
MATAIGTACFYKTAAGYIPAIITRAYDTDDAVVDNAASTDTSIVSADLIVLTYQPTKLGKVAKEVDVAGTDGAIAAGVDVDDTINSMDTGTWFTLT